MPDSLIGDRSGEGGDLDPATLSPTFRERFELGDRVGRGAMAAVFSAHDRTTGRSVALKFLLRPDDPDARLRFEQEARILGTLDHPNVVPVQELGKDGSHVFMVMPLIRGATLRQRLDDSRPFPASEAIELMIPILEGLEAAHQQGIVHRDLKPENVLIDESGRPWILDLGVAKSYGSPDATTGDAIVGTPTYMSPEQARGEAPGLHSDLYSAGILLFELLTASVPFGGKDLKQILKSHQEDPIPRVTVARPDLDPAWDGIFARALAKVPSDRYPDARAFILALQKAREGKFLISSHRQRQLAGASLIDWTASPGARILGILVLGFFPLLMAIGVLVGSPLLTVTALCPALSLFLTEVPSRFKALQARPQVLVVGLFTACLSLLLLPFLAPELITWEFYCDVLLIDLVVFGHYQGQPPEDRARQQKNRAAHLGIMIFLIWHALATGELLPGLLSVTSILFTVRALLIPPIDSRHLPLGTATTVILLGRPSQQTLTSPPSRTLAGAGRIATPEDGGTGARP